MMYTMYAALAVVVFTSLWIAGNSTDHRRRSPVRRLSSLFLPQRAIVVASRRRASSLRRGEHGEV